MYKKEKKNKLKTSSQKNTWCQSLFDIANISFVPELRHVHILGLFTTLDKLIFSKHFSQLSDSQLTEPEFLLLFPQHEHFLFLLDSLLIQLRINRSNFFLPDFLTLFFLVLHFLNFTFQTVNHFFGDCLNVLLSLFRLFGFLLV